MIRLIVSTVESTRGERENKCRTNGVTEQMEQMNEQMASGLEPCQPTSSRIIKRRQNELG